jgi:serine protease Do
VGIGFAIPALQAKTVVAQLKDACHVERGWLGVQIQKITDDLAQSLNLPNTKGALVAGVTPDSPAARAGIKAGDVIVSFDNKDIEEMKDLPRFVASTAPNQRSKLAVWRNGARSELAVEVKTFPVTVAEQTEQANQQQHNDGKLGLALAPISTQLRQQFGIEDDVKGSVVVGVRPQSIAAANGLRPGDVIMRAGAKSVEDPKDVVAAVGEASQESKHNKLVLLVNRQGNQWFLTLDLA